MRVTVYSANRFVTNGDVLSISIGGDGMWLHLKDCDAGPTPTQSINMCRGIYTVRPSDWTKDTKAVSFVEETFGPPVIEQAAPAIFKAMAMEDAITKDWFILPGSNFIHTMKVVDDWLCDLSRGDVQCPSISGEGDIAYHCMYRTGHPGPHFCNSVPPCVDFVRHWPNERNGNNSALPRADFAQHQPDEKKEEIPPK